MAGVTPKRIGGCACCAPLAEVQNKAARTAKDLNKEATFRQAGHGLLLDGNQNPLMPVLCGQTVTFSWRLSEPRRSVNSRKPCFANLDPPFGRVEVQQGRRPPGLKRPSVPDVRNIHAPPKAAAKNQCLPVVVPLTSRSRAPRHPKAQRKTAARKSARRDATVNPGHGVGKRFVTQR